MFAAERKKCPAKTVSATRKALYKQSWQTVVSLCDSAMQLRLRGSTKEGYNYRQMIWCDWVELHQVQEAWPATARTLCRFITSLARADLAMGTINGYLSAVSDLHRQHDQPVDAFSSWAVKECKRAWERIIDRPRVSKGAISLQHMLSLAAKVDRASLIEVRDQAMRSLAFFGTFRRAEISYRKRGRVHEEQLLRVCDVIDERSRLLVWLRQAKTARLGEGQITVIGARPGCPTCPRMWLLRWVHMARLRPEDPLFVEIFAPTNAPRFVGGKPVPLTDGAYASRVALAVTSLGLDSKRYTPHSFRIGGATELYRAGVSAETICAIGRWRSDVFRDYVRLYADQLAAATRRIGVQEGQHCRAGEPQQRRALELGSRALEVRQTTGAKPNGFLERPSPQTPFEWPRQGVGAHVNAIVPSRFAWLLQDDA